MYLVTVTKTNMIDKMPFSCGTLRNHCCEKTAPSLPQTCAKVSAAPKFDYSIKSNIVASLMHPRNCRCFQVHLRMLLQRLRAHCLAPGGPGSMWNNLGAPVRSTGVSWKFVCDFRTDLHFALERKWWSNIGRK
jgi:hypothetical protein